MTPAAVDQEVDVAGVFRRMAVTGARRCTLELVKDGRPTHQLWTVRWTQGHRRMDVEGSSADVALRRAERRSAAVSAQTGGGS